jgi:G3E family GTPase
MKVLVIGGFLGSGKTTAILNLGKYLSENNYRVAIIVNEIGEVGLDGDVISKYGFDATELTSGCICCSLKTDLRYTVTTLYNNYNPDILIIEPTGIAFPNVIRNEVNLMNLDDVEFAPLVTFIDGSRFKQLMKEIRHFSQRQIIDAEILVINKTDLIESRQLPIIEDAVHQLNPDADIIRLSAKMDDNKFRKFAKLIIEKPGLTPEIIQDLSEEEIDSIQCSNVATYSKEFFVSRKNLEPDTASSIARDIVYTLKDEVIKLNPEFLGHIKLYLEYNSNMVRISMTSYYDTPEVEVVESSRKAHHPRLKILTAVSNVEKSDLVNTVDRCVENKFYEYGIDVEKSDTHSHESHSH